MTVMLAASGLTTKIWQVQKSTMQSHRVRVSTMASSSQRGSRHLCPTQRHVSPETWGSNIIHLLARDVAQSRCGPMSNLGKREPFITHPIETRARFTPFQASREPARRLSPGSRD